MFDSNEDRPRAFTDEMKRAAAGKMADMLIEQNMIDASKEGIISDLIESFSDWYDGYSLARNLDRFHHWDPNGQMVEVLCEMETLRWQEHTNAVKAWVKRANPKAEFAVGDIVTFTCPSTGERTGPIFSIDTEEARYVVDDCGRGNGGRLVAYEDVRAA